MYAPPQAHLPGLSPPFEEPPGSDSRGLTKGPPRSAGRIPLAGVKVGRGRLIVSESRAVRWVGRGLPRPLGLSTPAAPAFQPQDESPCQAPRKSLLRQGMGVTGFSETSRWSPPRSPLPCWPWPPASPALVLPSFLKLPLTALLPGPVPWAQPGLRGDPAAPQEASRAGLGLMLGPSEGTQEITRRGARPATPVCVCVRVCTCVRVCVRLHLLRRQQRPRQTDLGVGAQVTEAAGGEVP